MKPFPGLLVNLCAVMAAGSLFGQGWTALGPEGGRLVALAADPTNSSVLYTCGDGGIFKSTDGGSSWSGVSGGPGAQGERSLAIDPSNSQVVYAASELEGILKTTNGGASWTTALGGEDRYQFFVAVRPDSPSTIFAGAGSIYRSTNSGNSWTQTPFLIPAAIYSLTFDRVSPATIYAATLGRGIAKSTDNGDHWTSSSIGLPTNATIFGLVIDSTNPQTFYVAELRGVYASTNAGDTWNPRSTGISLGSNDYLNFVSQDPHTPATLYAGSTRGLYRSTNSGGNWSLLGSDLSQKDVRALAFDSSNASALRAATHDGGFWKSSDSGAHWTAMNTGILSTSINGLAVDPRNRATLYAATPFGALKSLNGGATWSTLTPSSPFHDFYSIVVDIANSDRIYLGGTGGLFKSENGGSTWSALVNGLPSCRFVGSLTIDPITPGLLYAGTCAGALRSNDAGSTWSQIDGSGEGDIVAFLIDPANPAILYSGTDSHGLFKSTDRGASWTYIGDDIHDAEFNYPFLRALAIDPVHSSTLFAATQFGLFRSTNGGTNWIILDGILGQSEVWTVLFDPVSPAIVWAGTSDGLYRSTNGGSSWTLFGPLLDTVHDSIPSAGPESGGGSIRPIVNALAVDPALPNRIYAGTNGGVYTTTVSTPSPCTAGPTVLCLQGGRFRVSVTWHDQHSPTLRTGVGAAVPDTSQTGRFWFFSPDAVELLVKIIDGRGLNGSFWIFYGALSDVEYTITVIDTVDGKIKTFHNAPGNICGSADTSFSTTATSSVGEAPVLFSDAPIDSESSLAGASAHSPDAAPAAIPTPCTPSATTLCLLSNRFKVTVTWKNQHSGGNTGVGTAIPSTDQTGYFWFFSADATELAVKIVDGRGLNGKFWVFYGALSDVEYTITVTDTSTGTSKTYHNAPGNICGGADTSAF